VCLCRKPLCLYTFFDLLTLLRRFCEIFRERHDNTVIHASHMGNYVACSRVGNPTNIYIPAPEGKTKNISDISNRRQHSNFVTCLCFPINCRTRHLINSQYCLLLLARVCFCVVVDPFVRNMAHISLRYISTIYSVPLFCYMIHKIVIRFRHWSSRAKPGTPASISYLHI
jgi:hypothetical protein